MILELVLKEMWSLDSLGEKEENSKVGEPGARAGRQRQTRSGPGTVQRPASLKCLHSSLREEGVVQWASPVRTSGRGLRVVMQQH